MFARIAKFAVCVRLSLAALLMLGFAIHAEAQTVVVDINKAQLTIKYVAGVTPADGLNVKCGTVSGGPYVRTTQVTTSTTSIPVAKIIGVAGNWFCLVTDYVQTASGPLEGKGSNEVNFFGAVGPSGIITISIIP